MVQSLDAVESTPMSTTIVRVKSVATMVKLSTKKHHAMLISSKPLNIFLYILSINQLFEIRVSGHFCRKLLSLVYLRGAQGVSI